MNFFNSEEAYYVSISVRKKLLIRNDFLAVLWFQRQKEITFLGQTKVECLCEALEAFCFVKAIT